MIFFQDIVNIEKRSKFESFQVLNNLYYGLLNDYFIWSTVCLFCSKINLLNNIVMFIKNYSTGLPVIIQIPVVADAVTVFII